YNVNALDDVGGGGRAGIAQGDGAEHLVALNQLAKNGVGASQMGRIFAVEGDEKLAAVGAWPRVGHRQQAAPVKGQAVVKFVFKLVARTAGAAACGIAALGHEVGQDAVEGG